jgi:bifunctional non-homologous end joining protein LigD
MARPYHVASRPHVSFDMRVMRQRDRSAPRCVRRPGRQGKRGPALRQASRAQGCLPKREHTHGNDTAGDWFRSKYPRLISTLIIDSRAAGRALCKIEVMLWRSSAPALRPPGFIEPCLPTLGSAVPCGPKWAYEIKHDGFRFICRREGDRIRVFSRGGYDWADRVPRIADALAALRVKSATLDGEGVVCGPDGVTDFDRLRSAVARKGSCDASLFAFDLLEMDGTDLRREPWEKRRATLVSLVRKAGQGIRLSDHLEGADGEAVFHHACAMGLEGIVAKRRDKPYRSGRSPDWIKVKNPDAPAATRVMEF